MNLIKLYAYLQNNVGDDLMVELLMERYPDFKFWGCRGMQKKTRKLQHSSRYFDNEDVYGRWGRINHLVNILMGKKDLVYKIVFHHLNKKCICGITIGGSIYREHPGQTPTQRIASEEKKKASGTPYYVLGANFGPYFSEDFYSAYHTFFSSCSGVCFRDSYSFGLFKSLSNVRWAPDIVFTLDEGTITDSKKVIISVIDLEERDLLQRYEQMYLNKTASLCEYWIEKGMTPVLTSFCSYEGDERCVEKVFRLLTQAYKNKTEKFFYSGDTDAVISLFRSAHFVFATRFHAMVLAMRFRKPLFTLAYEAKIDKVLKDTNNNAFTTFSELEKYSPELINKMGNIIAPIDDYLKEAEKQYDQLDSFLLCN